MDDKEASSALSEELTHIKKVWWVLPDWAMVVGTLISAGLFFYFATFAGRLGSVVASLYFATQVAYRLGVYYGFARGFQQGREQFVSAIASSTKNGATVGASSDA